jgi:hypothetical protein
MGSILPSVVGRKAMEAAEMEETPGTEEIPGMGGYRR